MASSNDSPDKKALYGEFLRGETWKRNLQKKLSHKALDIAEAEDVNLSVNKSTGIGAAGLIAAVAAATLGPTILAGAILLKGDRPAGQASPADSNYKVLFYDKDGNPIQVPHISAKGK